MAPGGAADVVLAKPENWRIHDVSFKPWSAGRHANPTINAALKLRADLQPQPSQCTRCRAARARSAVPAGVEAKSLIQCLSNGAPAATV